jgi:hypothetical protein
MEVLKKKVIFFKKNIKKVLHVKKKAYICAITMTRCKESNGLFPKQIFKHKNSFNPSHFFPKKWLLLFQPIAFWNTYIVLKKNMK